MCECPLGSPQTSAHIEVSYHELEHTLTALCNVTDDVHLHDSSFGAEVTFELRASGTVADVTRDLALYKRAIADSLGVDGTMVRTHAPNMYMRLAENQEL